MQCYLPKKEEWMCCFLSKVRVCVEKGGLCIVTCSKLHLAKLANCFTWEQIGEAHCICVLLAIVKSIFSIICSVQHLILYKSIINLSFLVWIVFSCKLASLGFFHYYLTCWYQLFQSCALQRLPRNCQHTLGMARWFPSACLQLPWSH